MQKFIIRIEKETAPSHLKDAECYALNTALSDEYCHQFIQNASSAEKIVLFYGDNAITKAKQFEADGVIVELDAEEAKEKLPQIRKQLGKNSFIGLFSRTKRHESMLISEAEPDFIIFKIWKDGFENSKELTDWYNDFFLIQSASWLMEEDIDTSSLNTDFIICP